MLCLAATCTKAEILADDDCGKLCSTAHSSLPGLLYGFYAKAVLQWRLWQMQRLVPIQLRMLVRIQAATSSLFTLIVFSGQSKPMCSSSLGSADFRKNLTETYPDGKRSCEVILTQTEPSARLVAESRGLGGAVGYLQEHLTKCQSAD